MFKLLLIASVVICDLYLFHIISIVNPDFKLVNNLISSSLDKVTTGTYSLQSFIASAAPVVVPFTAGGPTSTCLCCKLVIMQFLLHFSSKVTSQLINSMFNALQKLPKYFNGIANYIYFLSTLFASCPAVPAGTSYVLPVILFLCSKALELTTFVLGKLLGLLSSLNSSL